MTTKSAIDPAFTGEGLLQSAEQWETRNRVIVQEMHGLMQKYAERQTGLALEVGCTEGHLTDALAARTDYTWYGVEPVIKSVMRSKGGIEIRPGFAHEISFPNEHFDCVVFANVYEHILPKWRMDSIKEINRVLRPGGVVIGQLPNPYFPIESHSRLPFMGWLPHRLQREYWKLTPTPWDFDDAHFFTVAIGNLKKVAQAQGFDVLEVRNFSYPLDVIPNSVRWMAKLHSLVKDILPWSWQFALKKRGAAS